MAALTTAFELTDPVSIPDWQERYEVTVYQMGWRLGGKGASGRGSYDRIEEHGLHIWMGWYENAFRVIQRCYAELGRSPEAPLATWEQAFHPHSFVVWGDKVNDQYTFWPTAFPTNDEVPGHGRTLPTLWDYIVMTIRWMEGHFRQSSYANQAAAPVSSHPFLAWVQDVWKRIGLDVESTAETMGGLLLQTARHLAEKLSPDPMTHQAQHHHTLIQLFDKWSEWLQAHLGQDIETQSEARRLFILLDLAATCVRGLLRDGVMFHEDDYIALDKEDLRVWLQRHGAAPLAVWSAPVQAVYDLLFAYENGDLQKPSLAAGTALYGIMRMCFTYKGALFWKMQAGMGDTIFAPLYEVLKRRGVTFRFFHRVTHLGLNAAQTAIETIRLGRQVTLKNPDYQPLIDVKGLPCWPGQPLYEQIVEGKALQCQEINLESFWTSWEDREEIVLRAGEHFDAVVLGISLGGIPHIGQELLDASAAWRSMVDKVQTVQTLAMQLWINVDLAALGWQQPSPVMDAYAQPFNTWADMSQLIDRESWPSQYALHNIAYFCGPMQGGLPSASDRSFPGRARAEVQRKALEWLNHSIGLLWPQAVHPHNPQGLNWKVLVDPAGGQEEARFQAQFWRANIDPSERYVLSLAGSTRYRLHSGASGFNNLYLTGDWTRTSVSAGCIEATVMSGMLAAHALSGQRTPLPLA